MSGLRVYMLGTLGLHCGERALPRLPMLKPQALLAYLILQRDQPQPRDRLAGRFWGDRPERRARRSLSTALWHIRRHLPDENLILSDAQTVQFDPQADLWLDVEAFTAHGAHDDLVNLQEAVALYRGDFLAGLAEDWIVDERYRLQARFEDVLARLMVRHEARGEHGAALATAQRLLRCDPLREDAHRLAMRAYGHLGQRSAALEQYHHCQKILQDELAADPAEETTELYQAILEGRFAVKRGPRDLPAAVPALEPPSPAASSPLDIVALAPFVGREDEFAGLQADWQRAQAGEGGLVLIGGEAGVGKTRLVAELVDWLRWQGARVLPGRCYEFERLLPYQPFAEALRGLLPALTPAKLTGLPPRILSEMARLLPELRERDPKLIPAAVSHSGQEQARLFDGLAGFLAHWSTQEALLLILEDLHWAGESTLQLLHYLARQLASQRVLLLGTFRPEEVDPRHRLQDLRRCLVREGLAQLHTLTPLTAEAMEALLLDMSRAGQAVRPLARRLYRDTAGNPFFLMEAVKALFELEWVQLEKGAWKGDFKRVSQTDLPLPLGVSELIQARVGRLSQEAQDAVHLAAVLGREFDYEPLEAAWGRGEEATLEALDELLSRRLVEEGTGAAGRDYAFSHHKIQEAVYAGIPQRHRQRLHAWVGAALEQVSGPDVAAVASELARHFLQASQANPPLADKAVHYLLLAGDAAAQVYANVEARQHYEQALALLETLPATEDNRRRRVDALIQMVAASQFADTPEQSLARLAEAEGLIQELSAGEELLGNDRDADRHRLARVHFWMGKVHFNRNQMCQAIACYQQVLAEAQGLGDPELVAIPAWTIGQVLHTQGWFGKAEPMFRQAIPALEQVGYWPEWIRAVAYRGVGLAAMGDPVAGIPEIHQAMARAGELQSLTEIAACYIYLHCGHLWIGDYPTAIETARRVVEVAEQAGDWLYVYLGHKLRAQAEVRAGSPAAATAAMARGEAVGEEMGIKQSIAEDWFTIACAEIALKEGRLQEALVLVEKGLEMTQAVGSIYGEGQARRVWGQILATLDPPQWEKTEAQWAESLRLMELAPMRLEAALLRVLWGTHCRDRGDPAAAREHWEQAAAQFETSGRTEDLERTRALLAALPES